jgi:hypothetical protein
MAGRPTLRTEELEDEILGRIISGESLNMICKEESKPNITTVLRWLAKDDDFAARYARAREMQAENLADQMLEIADDGTNDWMAKKDREGNNVGWQLNGEAVARSKLRLEQRRWYAEKLRPKVYGSKVAVGGASDLPPIKTTTQLDVSNLTLEELDVLAAALQKAITKDE